MFWAFLWAIFARAMARRATNKMSLSHNYKGILYRAFGGEIILRPFYIFLDALSAAINFGISFNFDGDSFRKALEIVA